MSELSELTKEAAAAFIQRWQGVTASELRWIEEILGKSPATSGR